VCSVEKAHAKASLRRQVEIADGVMMPMVRHYDGSEPAGVQRQHASVNKHLTM